MTKTNGGTTTIEAQYRYDPYGLVTKLAGAQEATFRYGSYYLHERSQLSLTTSRAYSANQGRFINRDPLGEIGGINLFDYVENNPILAVDPDGTLAITAVPVPGGHRGSFLGRNLVPFGQGAGNSKPLIPGRCYQSNPGGSNDNGDGGDGDDPGGGGGGAPDDEGGEPGTPWWEKIFEDFRRDPRPRLKKPEDPFSAAKKRKGRVKPSTLGESAEGMLDKDNRNVYKRIIRSRGRARWKASDFEKAIQDEADAISRQNQGLDDD